MDDEVSYWIESGGASAPAEPDNDRDGGEELDYAYSYKVDPAAAETEDQPLEIIEAQEIDDSNAWLAEGCDDDEYSEAVDYDYEG